MKKALIGLDIGTTSTKAVVFDSSGKELARAISAPYTNQTQQPNWVEQDPEEIWQAVQSTLGKAVHAAGPEVEISAMSIAAQSGSLIPSDKDGNPVYPVITWMDGRTSELVQNWQEEEISEKVRSISGWSLYPGLCLPSIAWLRENDPETFSKAQRFLSVNDFIIFHLTGQFSTNPSNAGGMQLLDLHSGDWSDYLLDLAGISTDQLSPIQPSGSVIGKITASETGLSPETVLVNGGHDQGMAALGLGVNSPGKILLACGTAWVITTVTKTLDIAAAPPCLDWNVHPLNDRWTNSQSLGGLGASLEWWLNQAWGGGGTNTPRAERFASLDAEMANLGSTKDLFYLPVTGGHDTPATVQKGGFVGLQINHNRANMAWAVMESAGFELRWALETIQASGHPIEELWMLGGAADSEKWPQILANITGRQFNIPPYDNWPAQGAAVLAGIGIGIFNNLENGIKRFSKLHQTILPDKNLTADYDDSFECYKQHKNLLGILPNN